MSQNKGERAFPHPINPQDYGKGMTLRDYFAAKALAGMMAKSAFGPGEAAQAALVCYRMADAMLKEREK